MKNLKKIVATGLVGLTLIAGAGAATYATWQVSDTAAIGEIRTGHMNISLSEATRWTDARNNHQEVDFANLFLIPGARIHGHFPVSADLVGTGLSARMTFAANGESSINVNGDTIEIRSENWSGATRQRVWVNGERTGITFLLGNQQWSNPVATPDRPIPSHPQVPGGLREFPVRIYFDAVSDADMDVIANLGSMQVSLTQIN